MRGQFVQEVYGKLIGGVIPDMEIKYYFDMFDIFFQKFINDAFFLCFKLQ